MIPWITSRSFIIDLQPSWTKTHGENEWAMGKIGVDLGSIHMRLERLIDDLNADQWEIKLIQPLQRGVTYHEHQRVVRAASRMAPETAIGGFGFGWGTEVTSGYVIIAQRTEYLTEAEYILRRDDRNSRLKTGSNSDNTQNNNLKISSEITTLQVELDQLRSPEAIQIKKTGLLRGEKFSYNGKDYSNQKDAELAKSARIIEIEDRLSLLALEIKPV